MFTDPFERILDDVGVRPLLTSYQAPNTIALVERFVGSVKRECLGRLVLFGAGHLQRAVDEYARHDHAE